MSLPPHTVHVPKPSSHKPTLHPQTFRKSNLNPHLFEQVVAEVRHELRAGAARNVLVAEALERLLERLVEEAAVGEAGRNVREVLVVQLDDLAHVLLLVAAAAVPAGLACRECLCVYVAESTRRVKQAT
eukprot:GHRQ01030671.1.p1 GENE.GHRQ01030671.1~~GHRQ01030671.1.p1  ORF type:complete len:129 (+),score=9.00 GHRQ01030671.1:50-436(+)